MQDTLSEGTARAAQLAPSAVTASAVGGSATRSVAGRVSPTTSGSSAVSPAGGSRPSPPRHQGFRVYRCLHYGKLSPAATKPTQNHSMLHITKQKLIHDVVNYPTGVCTAHTAHAAPAGARCLSPRCLRCKPAMCMSQEVHAIQHHSANTKDASVAVKAQKARRWIALSSSRLRFDS